MKFFEQIQRLERMDQLIRMKTTGSPKELACRLSLSERRIYDLIKAMKDMGAPISFNQTVSSYVYEEDGHFRCQFSFEKSSQEKINGGFFDFYLGLQESCSGITDIVGAAVGGNRKPCQRGE